MSWVLPVSRRLERPISGVAAFYGGEKENSRDKAVKPGNWHVVSKVSNSAGNAK